MQVAQQQRKEQKQKCLKIPLCGNCPEFHLLVGLLKICHFENSEVLLLEETKLY